jgi:PHD/YefM family antitoxin component YafN of YafNO toxin-antitoxin module
MLQTKYDVLLKNGKEQFVVIPMKEYTAMVERLEDDADFRAIEASKKRQVGSPRTPLEQVKRELGLARRRKKNRA